MTASACLVAEEISCTVGGRRVLEAVSCVIGQGEVVGLLAPSGAGKTTLLRSLVRLVEVDAGRIALHGTDIRTLDPCTLRRRIGLVGQTAVMLDGSVADNLRYGIDALAAAKLTDALHAAGLEAAFADRDARELSGGERARVALARALTRDPEVLLLDEPTASLDAEATGWIGQTLRRLSERGLGILVATHDVAFAEAWADRRLGLHE